MKHALGFSLVYTFGIPQNWKEGTGRTRRRSAILGGLCSYSFFRIPLLTTVLAGLSLRSKLDGARRLG